MQTIQLQPGEILKRKEIKELLGIKSDKTYYKVMRQSKIKGIKLGGLFVFMKTDILNYLESKKTVIL